MYLGNVIKDIDKKYRKVFFSGLAFNSSTVKKDNIFLQLKEINLMVINMYIKQSKRVPQLLFQKKNLNLSIKI